MKFTGTSSSTAVLAALARWRTVRYLLSVTLVVALCITVPMVAPQLLSKAHADPQPVSGAFGLGGGVNGSVDPRTGQFSVSVPLVNVASRGDSGISLTLAYAQSRAFAQVDRFGVGSGWSFGSTFVNTVGPLMIYPANGGSYAYDTTGRFPSGLVNYPMRDLTFAIADCSDPADCTLAARAGVPSPVTFTYTITYHNGGNTDYFDASGNQVARVDRSGNRTDLTYASIGANQFRPTSVVDAFGLTTTLAWTGTASLTASSPKRQDGVVSSTTVTFDAQRRVSKVTDPVGRVTTFLYGSVQLATKQYLQTVIGPAGAHSVVKIQPVTFTSPALTLFIARELDVTDADGNALAPSRFFDINPAGNPGKHNYAGYPNYVSTTGTDALFARADPGYRYTTSLSTQFSATVSTYDSLHRLISRRITAPSQQANASVTVQQHDFGFSGFATPANLPANYDKPVNTKISNWTRSGPGGLVLADAPRVTTTSSAYDDHGRVLSVDDPSGATTLTTYDNTYGLVTNQTKTVGTDVLQSTTNTLTADKKAVHSSTTSTQSPDGDLTARTVETYAYDTHGQVSSDQVGWASGAAPPDDGGGPASTTTSYATTLSADQLTRSIAVTVGAGTADAVTTTTAVDQVSGQPIQVTDGVGRVTTRTYDAAARVTKEVQPTGLVTTTAYTTADGDHPPLTTVTSPDGHIELTTYDGVGRVMKISDNVAAPKQGAPVAFTSDPTTRTTSSFCYGTLGADGCEPSQNGTVTATDKAGRTTVTTYDAVNRPITKTGPTGVTYTTTYDDVANAVVSQTFADGVSVGSTPTQTTNTKLDRANRQVYSRTTYPIPGTRPMFLLDPLQQTKYDALGRPRVVTDRDLTMVPDYAGPGGVSESTTVTPAKSNPVQSDPITSTVTSALDASTTANVLGQGDSTRKGTTVTYGAAGQVATSTDPDGKTTSYAYADDGRLTTTTAASGSTSTRNYDPTTGQLTSVVAKAPGGSTTTTSYTYVPNGQVGAGLVASTTNESGTITYGYDADRNRVSVSYPDASTTGSVYGANGLQQSSTDATGATTSYAYNPDSSLQSATQTRAGATLASVSYTYDGLDRIKTVKRGNGLTTTNAYTPNGMLASQITGDAGGNQVEAQSYAYDNHKNLTRKTSTTAKPTCVVACTPGPTTYGTYTTTYRYDSYDQLLGSAVYSGATPAGTPVTKLTYTLDAAGNVAGTSRTTTTTSSAGKKAAATTVTTNTLDAAGRLTAQQVGSTSTAQTFDADGRVLKSLSGTTTAYRPDGLPATVTSGGATTTFSYWPDGTRRQASTTDPVNGNSCVGFYYGAEGTLANDTTSTSCAAQAGATSASYLTAGGREARTLQPVTLPAPKAGPGLRAVAAAPVTTGVGSGYFLRDRHSSVTALVDSGGAVTNTYSYSDYGAPALLDGRPGAVVGSAAGNAPGQANGLRYSGAAQRAMFTDVGLGTMMTPARFYDPTQGRFTAPDVANVFNRYAGFDTNPLTKSDPTGLLPASDIAEDAIYMVVFAIAAVLVGIATLGAGTALLGAAAAETSTALLVADFATNAVAAAANAGGFVANSLLLINDIGTATGGKQLFSDDQRQDVSNISTVLGSVAGVAGMGAAGAEAAIEAEAAAPIAVEDFTTIDVDDDTELLPNERPGPAKPAPQANHDGTVPQNDLVGGANVPGGDAAPVVQPPAVAHPLPPDPFNGVPPPQDDPPPPPQAGPVPPQALNDAALDAAQQQVDANSNSLLEKAAVGTPATKNLADKLVPGEKTSSKQSTVLKPIKKNQPMVKKNTLVKRAL